METYFVDIKPDEEGFLGRECPECEKYFKIKPGTGIPNFTDCYCPYCRHLGPQDEFWTKQQIEYARSVVVNKVSSDLLRTMEKMERKPDRNQFLSIGITVKGTPTPITYYTEEELEERVTCSNCSLEYTIFGVFGFCPDCAVHNSKQIVEANFELVLKVLQLANTAEPEIQKKLVENALEDCVSVFDGFAREHCLPIHKNLSFQNIAAAKDKLYSTHNIDIADGLSETEWKFVVEQFQKRHLIAHKMGVIDLEFIKKTNRHGGDIGKKVAISESDVTDLIGYLGSVAENITKNVLHS